MRNWNALLLQTPTGVLDAAAHAGIVLGESRTADQEQCTHENKSLANYASFIHISSNATPVLMSACLLLTGFSYHKSCVGRNTPVSGCFRQQNFGGNIAGEVSR